MKNKILTAFVLIALLSVHENVFAAGKIKIVTTTSTLASLSRSIAGDKADIYFIASPDRDIHFITPTPKDVVKIKKADVFVHGGLDLEAWRGPLLDAVGRSEFMPAGERAIDASLGIPLLEIPVSLSRLQGDIHAFGNPHYWLDPVNGKIMAGNIAEGLARLYPEDADFFRKNAEAFKSQIDLKVKEWEARMAPYRGQGVIVYHNSWPYFLNRFGLAMMGSLEPKPGIPPTASHLNELVALMKEKKVKVILKEVFQENRTSQKAAQETGASVVTLASEAGEAGGDYLGMIEKNVSNLEKAFKQ